MFTIALPAERQRSRRRSPLVVESLEQRTVPAAGLGMQITAASGADSPWFPPDTDGSIGPNHFVEIVNGVYRVFNKSTGTQAQTMTDSNFWLAAGISSSLVNTGVSDPRVLYDRLSDRWIASEITINNNGSPGNSVLIARSESNDPTGAWKGVSFIPSGSLFADYDTLGIDANAIYIGTNNFPASGGSTSTTVISIPKADILAASPSVTRRTLHQQNFSVNGVDLGWTPQGVINFSPSPAHGSIFAVNNANFGQVNRTKVTGTDQANATFGSNEVYNVSPTADPNDAHQPDGTQQIDGIDDRFGSSVYQVGDLIYGVHCILVNGMDAVRLTIMSDSQNQIVAEGTWSNASFDYIDPSICANDLGDFVIGFTRSGGTSTGTAGRLSACIVSGSIDPANPAGGVTFGSEIVTKQGLVNNYHVFGNGDRWGDYSTTTLDPNNPTAFWTIQEYAAGTTTWGTQITEVFVSPRITGVSSTIADGKYGAGTVIPITVTFNDAVTVTGTPQLALNSGGTATYSSGTGTNTLTFNYTVAAGEASLDLDYTSTGALTLNGGTIKDTASLAFGTGVSAVLTLAAPGAPGSLGDAKNIIITNSPQVTNVTSIAANGIYGAGATIPVSITFSLPVVVTGTPQLEINAGNPELANYVSGSGTTTLTFNYVVQDGDSSPDLDYTSETALTLNGGTIKDQADPTTNADLTLPSPGGAGSLSDNKDIVINTSGALVGNVTSTNTDGTYSLGATIAIKVIFTRPVTVTGSPTLALNSSGSAAATYASGSGSTTLTFNYVVQTGDFSNDLDYTSSTALALNGGTIKDQATGADADLTLANPGAPGSLGANKNIVINALAATVVNVTSDHASGTFGFGTSINIQVQFNKPVNVTGIPKLSLNSGPSVVANYASGSGSNTLTFNYVVGIGDFTNDLDYTSTTALALSGGTIKDGAGIDASLTLPVPGTAGSISFAKDIKIDAVPAKPANITSNVANASYGAGAVIPITVTFSKTVTVTGSPQLALNSGGTATYSSGSGTNTLTFSYTVGGGESSSDLDYTSTGALTLNGGAITDVATNSPATVTLPAPGSAGSLGANKNIVVDAVGPTVVAFKVLFGRKSYDLVTSTRAHDVPWQITGIQVVFSEPVKSGNRLSLSGLPTRSLKGLGTTTLTWTFSSISKGSFNTSLLNSGANALKDIAGNPIAPFSMPVNVLYGDFNDDQVVNGDDEAGVRANLTAPYDLHPANYNIFADLSGDGLVNLIDARIAHSRNGQTLP